MTSRAALLPSLALALLAPACGHGLAQTAKTQPPGATRMTLGGVLVTNENDSKRHGVGIRNAGPELAVRVGTSEHTDVGIGTWLGTGIRSDVKWNLAGRDRPWAIAPRAGIGGAYDFSSSTSTTVLLALVGVIASYELPLGVTPYGAATFANHWIWTKASASLAPGESLAARAGYGDGLVQLVLGLQLRAGPAAAIVLEYQRWIPAQNDPGDFYRFVPNNVFLVGTSICFNRTCDWGR